MTTETKSEILFQSIPNKDINAIILNYSEVNEKALSTTLRLFIYFASKVNKAVILVRVKKTSWFLAEWNLENDDIVIGQWLSGHMYPGRCALSSDAQYFGAFVVKYAPKHESYVVLSKPPYFTALGLWRACGTWTGFPQFDEHRSIFQHYTGSPIEGRLPDDIKEGKVENVYKSLKIFQFHDGSCLETTDQLKRNIKVNNGQLFVNSKLIYDFRHETFRPCTAPYKRNTRKKSRTVKK